MMEHLAALDPSAVAGVFVTLLLTLCVVALFLMRDPESAPPRVVSRSIWCAAHRQRATVDFVERVETGLLIRTVQRCPLRGTREKCHQECCDLPAVEVQPRPAAITAHKLPASA